jgi:hypothetical protein
MAVGATGQVLLPSQQAELDVQTAYATLAANTGIRFDITGTQTDISSSSAELVIRIGGELYYQATTNIATGAQTINLDLFQTMNGVETFELIADGNTAWSYRPASQPTATYGGAYSATAYNSVGPAGAPQNPNYVHDLMTALTLGTPAGGPSGYAARLVRELFGNPATGPLYHSWMPMPPLVGPTEIAFPPVYQDPITGLYANPTTGVEQASSPTTLPETWWVIYNGAPQRAIAFELQSSGGNGPNTVNRVYYSERQALGSVTRVTQWTITPVVTNDFSLANFTAYPATRLRNWRPVIGPRISHL